MIYTKNTSKGEGNASLNARIWNFNVALKVPCAPQERRGSPGWRRCHRCDPTS